jgi:hypothetical protein
VLPDASPIPALSMTLRQLLHGDVTLAVKWLVSNFTRVAASVGTTAAEIVFVLAVGFLVTEQPLPGRGSSGNGV